MKWVPSEFHSAPPISRTDLCWFPLAVAVKEEKHSEEFSKL